MLQKELRELRDLQKGKPKEEKQAATASAEEEQDVSSADESTDETAPGSRKLKKAAAEDSSGDEKRRRKHKGSLFSGKVMDNPFGATIKHAKAVSKGIPGTALFLVSVLLTG
ncbi:MAG: hypothetical protein R3B47_16575 [Bacteroidia bacterium]